MIVFKTKYGKVTVKENTIDAPFLIYPVEVKNSLREIVAELRQKPEKELIEFLLLAGLSRTNHWLELYSTHGLKKALARLRKKFDDVPPVYFKCALSLKNKGYANDGEILLVQGEYYVYIFGEDELSTGGKRKQPPTFGR